MTHSSIYPQQKAQQKHSMSENDARSACTHPQSDLCLLTLVLGEEKESAFALWMASAELALSWQGMPHPRQAAVWASQVAHDLLEPFRAELLLVRREQLVLLFLIAPAPARLCWGPLQLRLLRRVKAL